MFEKKMELGVGHAMKEEFQEIRSIYNHGRDHVGISAVLIDPFQELVWAGNQSGHLTSYYGTELQRYTSFKAHHEEVRHLTAIDRGILSLTSSGIRFTAREGLPIFNLSGPNVTDLQCMLQKDNSSLLVAGHQGTMLEVDLSRGKVTKEVHTDSEPGIVVLKWSQRYVCCGDTAGKVTLRDPSTLKTEHVFDAHSGTLSDFDVSGNQLVTCGFSSRVGHMTVDRLLMVYDVRTLRALPPLQVSIEPWMLKFVPAFSSRLAVLSQTGQLQFQEPGGPITPSSMFVYQVNTHGSICTTFDISSTSHALAFGDSGGYVHLWGNSSAKEQPFSNYSRPTEFPHEVHHMPPLAIDDYSVALSSIPLPFCQEQLLSDWPEESLIRVDRRTPKIDPEILRSMVVRHFIGYAPNPGTRRRNQVAYQLKKTDVTTSTKGREEKKDVPESPMNREDSENTVVPKPYRRVEIRYSKLGVEDFDFRHYNKTSFAGLEIHIPNAYCNCMLQMLYFLEPMRVCMENHLCQREFCLACELGFLFQMLDKSTGQTVQASNFLRAFRTIPEASALGLVLNDAVESVGKVNFPRLIQSWFRFILQQVHQDTLDQKDYPKDQSTNETSAETRSKVETSVTHQMFGTDVESRTQCGKCKKETVRSSKSLVFELAYPDLEKHDGSVPFESLLRSTLCREQTTPAWCDSCGRYQHTVQTKKVKQLPDVLTINCHVEQSKELEFWQRQQKIANPQTSRPSSNNNYGVKTCRYGDACTRPDCKFRHERDSFGPDGSFIVEDDLPQSYWLPVAVKIGLTEKEGVNVIRIPEPVDQDIKCSEGEVVYDLLGTIAYMVDPKSGGNLVAHIHVGKQYHSRKEGVTCTQWYLFNDFAITPIQQDDALDFSPEWKLPCILVYARRDVSTCYDTTIRPAIDSSILYTDVSITRRTSQSQQFTPLSPDEVPGEGELVGLDAEFVTLNQEEAEIRCDGTRSTIKPSHMSVARITAVRGHGPLEGVPFIDDYISTSEQVVDYLTEFSGIQPGDLDATMSAKRLTTLKIAYQKLRALVDRKVKFVGHGLKKDFRVINILVPKDQVLDTVELFHLPRQRYISLRFLASYFLGINIQSVTHDSAEDALTALKLYRKYEEIKKQGEQSFRSTLRQLYEAGRKCSWKVEDLSTEQ